ncbi:MULTISPECIES: tetratricopeptide repeat protein [Aneurinibacillus]|jgi:predicted Zn-dependent protease|uniref:Tetratricopeptide repeat protein n=1 Tax=Aneurinibacillus thermoaerophilus TaxID=143495 RepID=A0A1G8DL45_ANETH|nr:MULTISPECIES: tetratricopeptide repeat protein [Aneurinibacillus]AMA71706.1 hypothetical protein ACH33_01855 [Aneurinibacillus sp. XH2]MED0680680.1 tetratricopeptide repeat protein [Aneurinibacillus thermoaerophilus]MED0738681.1 tetratricopeptide repeat protein [Aneurinibacillus thermoaerophilus]MED0757798.1 tetratricopeptide repeat protein [Aneurinibacillus thermoaerophilus]MED0761518.1 tetratricopeptide repeat protein [Aneurinibacillus thermoaerophilus]
MEEKVSGRTRNNIVYSLLGLTLIGIITAIVMGGNQDKVYQADAQAYMQAQKHLQQNQFAEAEKVLKPLLATHSDSYILQWRYASSFAGQGKYDEAEKYFIQARKQRPFLVRNQKYLVQYGEVLYKKQNYQKAKRYLEEAKKVNTNPQLSAQADAMLREMATKYK